MKLKEKKILWIIISASGGIILISSYQLIKELKEEWRRYQKEYKQLLERYYPNQRFSLGVRELTVNQFGKPRKDRCITCHIAIKDPRFKNYKNPLKTHPRLKHNHPFRVFGCTLCHQGNGLALTKYKAHGYNTSWPWPLISRRYIQGMCARCHIKRKKARPIYNPRISPLVIQGKELFIKKACWGCHSITGVSPKGWGPDLSEIGYRFPPNYLKESIKEPKKNLPRSRMPLFLLKEEEITSLVSFLVAQVGLNRELGLSPREKYIAKKTQTLPFPEVNPRAEVGVRIMREVGCQACHKMEKTDGKIGPDLRYEGTLREKDFIKETIINTNEKITDSFMPSIFLSPSQIEAMVEYLMTQERRVEKKAEKIYQEICRRCHGKYGKGDGLIAKNLARRPRDIAQSKFWHSRKTGDLKWSIRTGIAGTPMAPWGRIIGKEGVDNIFKYIKDKFHKGKKKEPKTRYVLRRYQIYTSKSAAKGEEFFKEECSPCHGLEGYGDGPKSFKLKPRPRNLRSRPYFKPKGSRRIFRSIFEGLPASAMSPWAKLGDDKIWNLVHYIRKISNTIPSKLLEKGKARP
jgi:mono/diheme cytochrome c family protein/uncharacterized protein with PIN domain